MTTTTGGGTTIIGGFKSMTGMASETEVVAVPQPLAKLGLVDPMLPKPRQPGR